MKKININYDNCIGCGACAAIDEEHFAFEDSDKPQVINNDNLDKSELTNAIASCPVNAISITNDESSCHCNDCSDKCNCCENCTCEDECHCDSENHCCDNCSCNN